MKNSIVKFIWLLFFCFLYMGTSSGEEFNFNVTEIEILENGNKFVGKKRGIVTSSDGIIIEADSFEYYKNKNILNARGKVIINDTINNYKIFTQKIIYNKNKNIIFTTNGAKAVDLSQGIIITALNFKYNMNKKIIFAENNAVVDNKSKDYKIYSNLISYNKNDKKIYSEGNTSAKIYSKYEFNSKDVTLFTETMELVSKNETTVTDKLNFYKLKNFKYSIKREELQGEQILINLDYKLPTNDKFYFSSGIVNLKTHYFQGKDAKIKVRKDIFDNTNNDPRLFGVSAKVDKNVTKINKGVFTSCKINKDCTPWSIKAKEIIHDKNKNEIYYNHALLSVYDVPVLYFPKFFHPDPTVDRRSGFLKPKFNNSNTLGNSFSIPYFSTLKKNRDFTITPYLFENNLQMIQNEYRKINQDSKFYANFGYVNNYKSSLSTDKNSIFNLFAKYELDLGFENFSFSKFYLSIEKLTNDTFLKIFDTHLQDSVLKPKDFDNLKSEIKIDLKKDNYNFETGIKSFENLQKINSDRYEYIFPYYRYNINLFDNFYNGAVNFSSNADNILNNTNVLKSNINNDLNYIGKEYVSNIGLKSNFDINLKNINSLGRNNSEYKSSPQLALMGEINIKSSYPLIKNIQNSNNYLTPKLLLKINPNNMKNYFNSDNSVNINNIFNNNRLSLGDTFESGRSLTVGLDYKRENTESINKFFEIKLASVLRDKEENFIPKKSTLNKKNSNVFGSVTNNFSDFFTLSYEFAIDNNLDAFEYSDLNAKFTFNNFTTKFNFLEESGVMGNSNFLDNFTSVSFDDQNYLTFKTRRNKKLNLTEYYDLVYEYKNDCLTAVIKYKKTYYEDRDLKPSENLFFTITLIPLTNYEQKIDR